MRLWASLSGCIMLALLAGGLQAMAIANPFNGQPLWWLQCVSLAILAWQLDTVAHVKHGFLLGFAFATTWLAGVFWWLFISMHVYGGLAAPVAVLAVLALASFLALYYAIAAALYVAYKPEKRYLRMVFFATLWLLAELARGSWLTGFPWGAGGYAHVDGGFAWAAPWVGVYGIGALAAALAMGWVQWLAYTRSLTKVAMPAVIRSAMPLALVLSAIGWLGAAWLLAQQQSAQQLRLLASSGPEFAAPHTSSAPDSAYLQVSLLQGNIAQNEKFDQNAGVVDALRWYGAQLQASSASLVVAPETALPMLPQDLPDGYWQALQARFTQIGAADAASQVAAVSATISAVANPANPSDAVQAVKVRPQQAVLIGVPLGSATAGYTNSIVGWKPQLLEPYVYSKHHLVPFGEFIPPFFRWFTDLMRIPLGDFARGRLNQASFEWQGQRLAPHICYEDLFGEELAVRFIQPEKAPTILVNASNIGWFGNSIAIDQHLHIARMRALEFARPVIRATNTGATVVINHQGQVSHALARYSRGVLNARVEGRGLNAETGWQITPYAWWAARFGLWPLWALGLGVVGLVIFRSWRGQRR